MQKPVCTCSPKPGITRCVQEVNLEKQLFLLDTPAIVAARTSPLMSRALRSLNLPELEFDPVSQVEAIFPSFNKEDLMLHYALPKFSNSHEFLQLLGQRWGQSTREGKLDSKSTARSVLVKWGGGCLACAGVSPLVRGNWIPNPRHVLCLSNGWGKCIFASYLLAFHC
uniref:Uncharacterized protein n=1 Tax=Eptatretus burgeri TaxID=7764 RepID=A0A8C4NFW9_EPTBU